MTAGTTPPRLTMIGSPDAMACEGDACLLPGAELPVTKPTVEPSKDEWEPTGELGAKAETES